jgi:hypothetical protein
VDLAVALEDAAEGSKREERDRDSMVKTLPRHSLPTPLPHLSLSFCLCLSPSLILHTFLSLLEIFTFSSSLTLTRRPLFLLQVCAGLRNDPQAHAAVVAAGVTGLSKSLSGLSMGPGVDSADVDTEVGAGGGGNGRRDGVADASPAPLKVAAALAFSELSVGQVQDFSRRNTLPVAWSDRCACLLGAGWCCVCVVL